ncbi:SMI1/KNR4 family protein [Komagataeibacter melomenusus]
MIKISHAKSMPSPKEIAAVEARIDAIFNNEYLQFIRQHNGAEIRNGYYDISEQQSSYVRYFIEIEDIANDISLMADDEISQYFFPFAIGSGGTYFLMKKKGDACIYYYDSDYMGHDAISKIAQSFNTFMNNIKSDTEIKIEGTYKVVQVTTGKP